MRHRLLSSIISLHAIAALTGCGGGSGADDPEQHIDPPSSVPIPKYPQGFWQGTTASGRAVSGVVTEEGDYWLVYTPDAGNQTVAGFYTGRGIVTSTTPPDGTFTSSNLRDVSFNTSTILVGTISVPANATTNYSAENTLSGSLDPVSVGASTYTISGSFVVTATIYGSPLSVPLTVNSGSYDTATDAGSWNMTADLSGLGMGSITWDQTFSLDEINGLGTLDAATGCAPSGIACSGIGPQFVGPITADGTTLPIHSGVQSWSVALPNFGTAVFAPTLAENLLPSIAADSFNLTYSSAYETTPDLTALAGQYNGTAGVGTTLSAANTATFNIDSGTGAITGDATIGGGACHYVGAAAVHPTGGNVYDITLTVSNCTAASGEFAGVATYDAVAKRVTVTATTTAAERDQGFLFVGVKP